MPHARSIRSDYTGFMVNRIAYAAFLLALAAPSWAINAPLNEAQMAAGGNPAVFDGSGSKPPTCADEACLVNGAASSALKTGDNIVVTDRSNRPIMVAQVPNPSLVTDAEGAKDEPGFFSKLTLANVAYTLGGAAVGVGIGWMVGGPVGAIVGGLLGAAAGYFLSKMLAN